VFLDAPVVLRIYFAKFRASYRHAIRSMRRDAFAEDQYYQGVAARKLAVIRSGQSRPSDGAVFKASATGPSRLFSFPWHEAQYFLYVSTPALMSAFCLTGCRFGD